MTAVDTYNSDADLVDLEELQEAKLVIGKNTDEEIVVDLSESED